MTFGATYWGAIALAGLAVTAFSLLYYRCFLETSVHAAGASLDDWKLESFVRWRDHKPATRMLRPVALLGALLSCTMGMAIVFSFVLSAFGDFTLRDGILTAVIIWGVPAFITAIRYALRRKHFESAGSEPAASIFHGTYMLGVLLILGAIVGSLAQ